MAERSEIRRFISVLGPTLERAQAQGTLARTKLDVRDQFEATTVEEEDSIRSRSLATFTEELDAFCADMRLAGVTVQQQVERHTRRWLRGFLLGGLGGSVTFIVGLGLAGSGAAGFGALVAFVGAPAVFIWLLTVCSRPEG